jgi:hypothetical protein
MGLAGFEPATKRLCVRESFFHSFYILDFTPIFGGGRVRYRTKYWGHTSWGAKTDSDPTATHFEQRHNLLDHPV